MNTLIRNVSIFSNGDVIQNGYIGIKDDLIDYIGEETPLDFPSQIIIDGKNKIAIPGLVNTHTHTPMTLFRGYADGLPLEQWLFDKIFPAEDKLVREDCYWASLLSIAEMLKSGVTAFADMYFFMDAILEAVEETGIKAQLSRGLQCFENGNFKEDRRILENISLFEKYNSYLDGRIKIAFAPHSVYTCTPEYLAYVAEVIKSFSAPAHIHLSETEKENMECLKKYGKTPTAHLNELGYFETPTILAHCVHLEDKDIEILKDKNVNISINMGSNLKLGSGIADVLRLDNAGLNLCIGTDGASSNNNLNMFEEINLVSMITKGIYKDPTVMKAAKTLEMATKNGANALGFVDSGEILVGKKADIILVNLNKPHLIPNNDTLANIVYSAQASDVDTVIIDGKIIIDHGEFKTLDFEEVKYNINKIIERII